MRRDLVAQASTAGIIVDAVGWSRPLGEGEYKKPNMNVASWIAIGIGIGAAIGAGTGHIGVWVALGVPIGVGMYAAQVLWNKSRTRGR